MAENQEGPTVEELAEQLRVDRADFEERINELERELEDPGWDRLYGMSEMEFSREGLRKICLKSFLFYLKNPLIRRAVQTQANYVFGQGITIKAEHPVVDEVVQAFLSDRKNKKVFTTIITMVKEEIDLGITANLFPVLFSNSVGDVRLSMVSFDEIWDIKTNPEDKNEPWYYVRKWTQNGRMEEEYYPDWEYRPKDKPAKVDEKKVNWDSPIHHIKVNAVLDQKFGTSEVYSAQDWARAYNQFLADWATIVRSYARFAWDVVKKSGPAGRLAARTKLDSQISQGSYQPPPAAASAFIHGDDTKLSPIKTAGATTSADDGRRLLLMVCAATGWPETFFGDVSVGTLATAKSLDRPSELKCVLRQRMWEIIWEDILAFVIQKKAEAGYTTKIDGVDRSLSGAWEKDAWDEETFLYDDDAGNEDPDLKDQPIDTTVSVSFPSIIEHSMKDEVDSVVAAATLGGNPLAGTLDAEYTTERLLRALEETSIEEVMGRLFPEGEEPEAVAVATAVQDLQQAIEALSESKDMERGEVVKILAETFALAFKEATGAEADG